MNYTCEMADGDGGNYSSLVDQHLRFDENVRARPGLACGAWPGCIQVATAAARQQFLSKPDDSNSRRVG